MKFKIRSANNNDATDIANICTKSWKSTYQGIIDQTFLDQLDIDKQIDRTQKTLRNPDIKTFIAVETESDETIGYSMFGPCREKNIDAEFELYAIYLYEESQGFGAGKLLFDHGYQAFIQLKHKKMMVSVLAKNTSARLFYEKMGGQIANPDRADLGGRRYPTDTYVWGT